MSSLFSKPAPVVIQGPAPVAPAPVVAPVEPKPPAEMPDVQAPVVKQERRRAEMTALQRGGRASTILTAPGNRASGDTYGASKLGSG